MDEESTQRRPYLKENKEGLTIRTIEQDRWEEASEYDPHNPSGAAQNGKLQNQTSRNGHKQAPSVVSSGWTNSKDLHHPLPQVPLYNTESVPLRGWNDPAREVSKTSPSWPTYPQQWPPLPSMHYRRSQDDGIIPRQPFHVDNTYDLHQRNAYYPINSSGDFIYPSRSPPPATGAGWGYTSGAPPMTTMLPSSESPAYAANRTSSFPSYPPQQQQQQQPTSRSGPHSASSTSSPYLINSSPDYRATLPHQQYENQPVKYHASAGFPPYVNSAVGGSSALQAGGSAANLSTYYRGLDARRSLSGTYPQLPPMPSKQQQQQQQQSGYRQWGAGY